MAHSLRLLLATAALLAAPAWAQALYKHTLPDGRVVFSDKPPSQDARPMDVRVSRPSAVPHQADKAAPTRSKATSVPLRLGQVTLYTTQWCGYCAQARRYLNQRGIAFTEIDTETPAGKLSFARLSPDRKGVPLLVAQGLTTRGFSTQSYDQFFAQEP